MNRTKSSLLLLFGLTLMALSGCDRKNNPLLSLPSGGTTAVTLFIPQIDTSGSHDANRVFVYAADQTANPLTGFQLGNFNVFEDGQAGVPFEVGVVNEPLSIVLAIDRSGSMNGPRTTAANNAAISFISALQPSYALALVEFNEYVYLTSNFTTNHQALINYLNSLTDAAAGWTSLYDASFMGANLLGGRSGRRMLLVMTDGEDTSSFASLGDAISRVNANGLSIYPVGLGLGFDAAILQKMANDTGGTAFSSTDGTDLSAIYLTVLERFENLTYVKYRRHTKGDIKVYLNYGDITASATKRLD